MPHQFRSLGRNVLTREVAKDGDTANMPRPAAIEAREKHHRFQFRPSCDDRDLDQAGGAPVFIRPRTLVKAGC